MNLTIVAPVYNESQNLDEFCRRCLAVFNQLEVEAQLVLVDDGSKDDSVAKIKSWKGIDSRIKLISFTRNFGHQQAISAGLERVDSDFTVVMDSDLQDPPEVVVEMMKVAKDGCSIVVGKRRKRKGESFFKLATAKLFYRLMQKITAFDIPLDTGDFRLIDRKVLQAFKQFHEQNKFIRGIFAWTGFETKDVVYDRDERKEGKTNFKTGKMIRFALDGITSFSDFPLKMATYLGFIFAFISFCIILYAFVSKYIWQDFEPGWTSLIISITFIGSVQLITVGVIGEYISRIHHNTRNRPMYVVKEEDQIQE